MKIRLTTFGARHFDPKFGGTKILNKTVDEFHEHIDNLLAVKPPQLLVGYAPFCRLWPIANFTDARVGSLPITLSNYQYLRSGYSARRDGELPVFSRWLELPVAKPAADWLMLVLYDNEQLLKESREKILPEIRNEIYDFNCDYGIVAVLGQSMPFEEPMKPETMIRNSLGISEGGSGVSLNREAYLRAVEFWEKNATVK